MRILVEDVDLIRRGFERQRVGAFFCGNGIDFHKCFGVEHVDNAGILDRYVDVLEIGIEDDYVGLAAERK